MQSDSWAKAERPSAPDSAGEAMQQQFFVDKDSFVRQGRSLRPVLQGRLCPTCQSGTIPEADLMARLERCCAKAPGFISASQPVQERVFRLLLANGGRPLMLGDIVEEVKRRSGLTVSEKALGSILARDTFYGIRPVVPGPPTPPPSV